MYTVYSITNFAAAGVTPLLTAALVPCDQLLICWTCNNCRDRRAQGSLKGRQLFSQQHSPSGAPPSGRNSREARYYYYYILRCFSLPSPLLLAAQLLLPLSLVSLVLLLMLAHVECCRSAACHCSCTLMCFSLLRTAQHCACCATPTVMP